MFIPLTNVIMRLSCPQLLIITKCFNIMSLVIIIGHVFVC